MVCKSKVKLNKMFCIISAILLLNLRFSFAKLTIDNYTYFFYVVKRFYLNIFPKCGMLRYGSLADSAT